MAAGLALTAVLSGPAYALTCPVPAEQNSLAVRALQAKLMVAALSCSSKSDYNRFVRLYTPHLANHAGSLRSWFRKLHGKGYRSEINRFVTLLANDASMRSIGDRGAFCTKSQQAFSALLQASRLEAASTLRAVAFEKNWRQDVPTGCTVLTHNRKE